MCWESSLGNVICFSCIFRIGFVMELTERWYSEGYPSKCSWEEIDEENLNLNEGFYIKVLGLVLWALCWWVWGFILLLPSVGLCLQIPSLIGHTTQWVKPGWRNLAIGTHCVPISGRGRPAYPRGFPEDFRVGESLPCRYIFLINSDLNMSCHIFLKESEIQQLLLKFQCILSPLSAIPNFAISHGC